MTTKQFAKNLLLFCALVLISSSIFAKYLTDTVTYKIGLPIVPGFMNVSESGTVKGFPLELFESVAIDENIKHTWVKGTWNELYNKLLDGELDVLPGTQVTSERQEKLDFLNEALYTMWSELYLRKNEQIRSVTDLSGKKIGYVNGDNNAKGFEDYIKSFNIKHIKVQVNSHEHGIQLLENRVIDALIGPSANIMNRNYKSISSSGLYFNPTNSSFAFPKNKNPGLAKKIDDRIKIYKADPNSAYHTLYRKYELTNYKTSDKYIPKWLGIAFSILAAFIVIAIVFLVTLRRQVFAKTQTLLEREVLLHQTMDVGNMATWEINPHKWEFFLSPKIYEILGYDFAPQQSLDFMQKITHPEDYEFALKTIKDTNKNHQNFDIVLRLIKKNNDIMYARQIGMVDQNIDSKHFLVRGIMQDITAQKTHEKDLIIAKEKAEQSEKLKSAFLANMSHEIRTPLNAIVGFSELLTNSTVPQDKASHFNKIINEQNAILLNLINDIIDFAKIESGSLAIQPEPNININQLIKETYFTLKPQCPENITFEITELCAQKSAILTIDKYRFKQIINNLILNAFRYTNEGFINIGSRLNVDKTELEIFVTDSGVGISEENQKKVFERFFQADSMTQGTGLGLSICKSLTHLMGGKIGLNSKPGKGSEFSVSFPIFKKYSDETETNMDGVNEENVNLNQINLKDIKALIVEDLMSNYLLIETLLEELGTQITWAQNGAEAVDLIKENSFDIILMDLKMPIMDGFEATKLIKQMKIETPIIAVTAYVFDADREKALAAGCNDYISKPIDKDELIETVGKALGLISI